MDYFILFGNCPQLSYLESLSFFEKDQVSLFKNNLAFLQTKDSISSYQEKASGFVKILEKLFHSDDIEKIESFLIDYLIKENSEKKILLSVNNSFSKINQIDNSTIKDKLKGKVKIRFVKGQAYGVNSGYFLNHKVKEFFIIENNNQYYLATTSCNQNVKEFIKRDRSKPYSQRLKGMLPPKIANMMVNSALHLYKENFKKETENLELLDPFCGSGTILIEGLLQNLNVTGSDLDRQAVMGCQNNLIWLSDNYNINHEKTVIFHNALQISHILKNKKIDLIVTEPFLGKQASRNNNYQNIFKGLEKLYLGFFKEISKVLSPENIIVFIFPRVEMGKKIYSLKKLEKKLEDLGFEQAHETIDYYHPLATVKREIHFFKFKK
jgi:tRNA G10  N-methylase Trm11